MSNFIIKVRTAFALGILNIFRIAGYRIGVKLRLNPVHYLQANIPSGPFFLEMSLPIINAPEINSWKTNGHLFNHWVFSIDNRIPDWWSNPFTGQRLENAKRPWFQISDFNLSIGDIKQVWELSRMNWVLAFAQNARNGDSTALNRLNTWLADWCKQNEPYLGPNWKCGQEASIRVMHLAMAALILDQAKQSSQGLLDMIVIHLQRISPTIRYAIAQDNNHGISEAAALFIGGSWLVRSGFTKGKYWERIGRHWLENRARRLIGKQGSFSQYSLNYHRFMLDTFCMVEVWRFHLSLPSFSSILLQRIKVATNWLHHMINPFNGDGSNIGANDGAHLLQLTNTSYRDYRPTVQLAMVLFVKQAAYESGPWNHTLHWLGIKLPRTISQKPGDYIADDGGFAMLRRGQYMAMLRYPRFRFRPSQSDALHLDVWLREENLLRDAGTYSYNTDSCWMTYFDGTMSHNTVQFDGRNQMPRLGRFLLGNWLKTDILEPLTKDISCTHFGVGYTDSYGASHHRQVYLYESGVKVVDQVTGFLQKAVLRWRCIPGDWRLEVVSPTSICCSCLRDHSFVIVITSCVPLINARIVEGWESRHYLEKQPLPVLELEVHESGVLTTELY